MIARSTDIVSRGHVQKRNVSAIGPRCQCLAVATECQGSNSAALEARGQRPFGPRSASLVMQRRHLVPTPLARREVIEENSKTIEGRHLAAGIKGHEAWGQC